VKGGGVGEEKVGYVVVIPLVFFIVFLGGVLLNLLLWVFFSFIRF